jgi:hypothetical protein
VLWWRQSGDHDPKPTLRGGAVARTLEATGDPRGRQMFTHQVQPAGYRSLRLSGHASAARSIQSIHQMGLELVGTVTGSRVALLSGEWR